MRDWSILTKGFAGSKGQVEKLQAVRVEFGTPDASGRRLMEEVPGSSFEMDCDLVLLALGLFGARAERDDGPAGFEIGFQGKRGNGWQNTCPAKLGFSAGDMRRGQSLVVWAIAEGRQAARSVDKFLMGSTELP